MSYRNSDRIRLDLNQMLVKIREISQENRSIIALDIKPIKNVFLKIPAEFWQNSCKK